MDDLISRQAAIDALKVAYWDNDIQSAKDDPCIADAMTDWAIRQIKALPSAQPEPQWIPCGESLPDEDCFTVSGIQYSSEVLATVINHGADDETFVDMLVMVDGEWKMVHPIDGGNDIADWCEVVAWMPLPKPYEEESDG